MSTAACQIKVFKSKGADRKHKQEKEKLSKRPREDTEGYQMSCDRTVLTEVLPQAVEYPVSPPQPVSPVDINAYSDYNTFFLPPSLQ